MIHKQRARFWMECGLAVMTISLCLLSLVQPAWIETAFGVDPDGRSGAFEWSLVAVLALASVILGVLAWAEWARRPEVKG